MNKIGTRIKDARKAKGLTQKEFARLLDCSHTTISKYEQGEVENIPQPRMKLMAEILEVSPIVLFDLVDKAKQPVNNERENKTEQPAKSELSKRQLEFIKRVEKMTDAQLDRLEKILDLIDKKEQ